MRSPDPSILGDETLFRTAKPDDCTGDKVMRLDDHGDQGTSVTRSRYILSLKDCFKNRPPDETELVHTTPDKVAAQNPIKAPAGQTWSPWELRVVDMPLERTETSEEDPAHAEIQPFRPGATRVKPIKSSDQRKAVRRAIVAAFNLFRPQDTTSVPLGVGLQPVHPKKTSDNYGSKARA